MSDLYIAVGPESTGKTTLCTQLARKLRLPLVSEAARGYLEARMRLDTSYSYTITDLFNIAQIQQAAESISLEAGQLPLICDTDLLVLMVWCEEKFGTVIPWISQAFEEQLAATNRHYFLCDWDIPWQEDPLRENPHDRKRLFEKYEVLLSRFSLTFSLLEGSAAQRLEHATSTINKHLP